MSIQTVILVTHDKDSISEIGSAQPLSGLLMPSFEPKKEVLSLINFFQTLSVGVRMGSVQVGVSATPGVAASGSVTAAGTLAADTLTIAGVVLTAVSGTPGANQFDISSGNNTTIAANIAAAINAQATLPSFVSASSSGAVVTVTAATQCALGNLVTLASSNAGRLALSGAALTGGAGNNGSLTTYKYGV